MYLKASYTVEAAVVISVCLMIVAVAIGISYDMFVNTLDYVTHPADSFDAVGLFRIKEGLAGLLHAIGD